MAEHPILAGRILRIEADDESIETTLKALGSARRLRILRLLSDQVLNVSEIAQALDLPTSTATMHINALESAGLITTELRPAERGLQKTCARAYDVVVVQLSRAEVPPENSVEVSMPVGAYVDCSVTPTCGLASETGIIGLFDDPTSFFEPERMQAQLLWFHHGYVEYRFPNRLPPGVELDSLAVSMEICSEAPLHYEEWPSDITLWLNGVEIGTWTCPGDFGGQRGALTPKWWESWNSQYGVLKVWQVNQAGSFVDGRRVSEVRLADLSLTNGSLTTVRVGVKPDARHVGGINIFGRSFGNYPQDIILRMQYH